MSICQAISQDHSKKGRGSRGRIKTGMKEVTGGGTTHDRLSGEKKKGIANYITDRRHKMYSPRKHVKKVGKDR